MDAKKMTAEEAIGQLRNLAKCSGCDNPRDAEALAHLQAMAEENAALKAEVERWKDEAKAIEVLMLMADGDRTIFKARAEKAEAELARYRRYDKLIEAVGKLTETDKSWLLSKVDWAIAEYVPAIEGMVCPGAAMKDRFRALLAALDYREEKK